MKSIKKLKSLALRSSLLLLCFLFTCSLHAELTNFIIQYNIDPNSTKTPYDLTFTFDTESPEHTAVVTYFSSLGTPNVVIPSTIHYNDVEYTVIGIGQECFANRTLYNISMAETVTTIGDRVFKGCTMDEITIPGTVKTLGTECFSGSHIKKIILSEGVQETGNGICSESKELISVSIPSTLKKITIYSFSGCTSLTDVSIAEGVESIGYVGDYWVWAGAFQGCSSLESIKLPNSVEVLGVRCFSGCTNLKQVNIPKRVTYLSESIFENCVSLESIKIPESVTYLENATFKNCESLKSITIPYSLKEFRAGIPPFLNCPLESIEVDEDNPYLDSRGGCNAIIETGTNKLVYGCKNTVIPSSVNSIGYSAFMNVKGFETLELSSNGGVIEENAFLNCEDLKSVVITGEWVGIQNKAFSGCAQLTQVTLPKKVDIIGGHSFENCTLLESIEMPEEVKTYGTGCVLPGWGASFMDGMHVSNGQYGIAPNAFKNCTSLKSMTIPSNAKRLYNDILYNCPSLETLTIPYDVTEIGERAFFYCENLKHIYCYAPEPPVIAVNTFEYADYDNCIIHVPTGAVEKYRSAPYWKKFKNIVGLTTPVSSITLDVERLDLAVNGMYTLRATVLPENATDNSITWASSNTNNVMVLTNGMVIALNGEGAIITATANDGSGVVATCYVNMEKTATIVDGEDYAETESVDYDKVYYKRTFKNTNLQALYVPIAINVEDIPDFKVYKIGALYLFDENQNGIYYEEEDMSYLKLLSVNTGVLKPNHPYYIQASAPGDVVIPSYDNILYAAEENTIESCTVETRAIFHGNYTKQTFDYDIFALSGGNLALGKGATLPAFRWYMTVEDKGGQLMQIPSDAKIQIITDDDDMANSIDEKIAAQKQTVKTIYTVDGMQHNALQKGLNIIRYSDGTTKKYLNK